MTDSQRLEGKTAFITGIARGQGRAHAIRLAEQGANIVGLDICAPIDTIPITMATEEDLKETVRLVESTGRSIVARVADTRDQGAVDAVVAEGLAEFDHIDVVVANAGTGSIGQVWELSEAEWQTIIDVNLTGTFHTVKSVIPHMIDAGRGGSIIITASVAALRALPGMGHYAASKHGVVGLSKNLAVELGPFSIRSNVICPGNTRTPLAEQAVETMMKPILATDDDPDWKAKIDPAFAALNPLGVAFVDAEDQADAVLWLASNESRYVTGQTLTIDAGWSVWTK